jgi:hypothetical protein
LEPFSYSEITDFFLSIKPQHWCGFLEILKHVMGFCHCEVLLTPLIQVMGERDDFDIFSSGKQFFCLLAFYAMF